MHRLEDELDPDEPEHDREPIPEEHQPVEESAEQEVELGQPHEGESVGGEDEIWLLGQPEDGWDRVEGEQQVGASECHHHHKHRSEHPATVHHGAQAHAVEVRRRRHHSTDQAQQRVLGVLVRLLALPRQGDRRPDQERAEQVEDPREPGDHRRAGGDEDAPEHQREQDPDH